MQAITAYFALASMRSNATAEARVSDAVIASMVPKVRGAGTMGEDNYRKGLKRAIESWGLVRYQKGKPSGSGKPPTTYYFPIVERMMDSATREGESPEYPEYDASAIPVQPGQSPNGYSGSEPDNFRMATPVEPDNSRMETPEYIESSYSEKNDRVIGFPDSSNQGKREAKMKSCSFTLPCPSCGHHTAASREPDGTTLISCPYCGYSND